MNHREAAKTMSAIHWQASIDRLGQLAARKMAATRRFHLCGFCGTVNSLFV